MAVSFQVTFDCANPDGMATFWAEVLGYKKQDPPQGYNSWPEFLEAQHIPEQFWDAFSAIVDPKGVGSRIFFQKVPEPKTSKNRVHLDVNMGYGFSTPAEERRQKTLAEVERLTGLGASKIREVEERGEHWIVMADPEGNEFCLQ